MYNIESKFVETPARKLATCRIDLTTNKYSLESGDKIKDAAVNIDIEVWQDEADAIDQEKIKNDYLASGAESVEVNLIRKPRENVRSLEVLEKERLRDKVKIRAELNQEEVSPEILAMCDRLEAEDAQDILSEVARGSQP